MFTKGEILQNRYVHEDGQLVDTTTGEIIDKKQIKEALQQDAYMTTMNNTIDAIELGIDLGIKLVKDKRGNEYHSLNVKEGFHFVKVFKVDVRNMLESSKMSIISRGFIYSCLAYIHFPTNTLIINGESPSIETICEKFQVGKSKLYQIFKELEQLDIIVRKKINGQLVIYINPFLHSSGLVDINTYKLFKDSLYNPINRGEKLNN